MSQGVIFTNAFGRFNIHTCGSGQLPEEEEHLASSLLPSWISLPVMDAPKVDELRWLHQTTFSEAFDPCSK